MTIGNTGYFVDNAEFEHIAELEGDTTMTMNGVTFEIHNALGFVAAAFTLASAIKLWRSLGASEHHIVRVERMPNGNESIRTIRGPHHPPRTTDMTDNIELWKQLKLREAELLEQLALSEQTYDIKLYNALANVRSRLIHIKEARDIRDQLAKIEGIGKP